VSDYWFLIHDTCKVGSNFKNLITENLKDRSPEKIALTTDPSMSIGLYSYNFLLSSKTKILNVKNTDYSKESLLKWKHWAVMI